MSKDSTKKFAIGTIVAALAGYIAGILTAPKSGKETRQDIKSTAQKTVNEAERQLKKLHTQMNTLINEGKSKASTLSGKAKDELDSLIETTKDAKEKAREILSAIHEGETEDRNLQKAIDDAQKAVDHLKAYLAK